MKKTVFCSLALVLFFVVACTEINKTETPCLLREIDSNSCEFGTYTKTENGCPITTCRPSADFNCNSLKEGDNYYDGCNTCTCDEKGEKCTELACPSQERLRGEGEMCGGIAGFQCKKGLICELKGDYPDASGICAKIGEDSSVKGGITTIAEYSANIDYSCTRDEDCTIKDVHNCCGYYPRCSNKDSYTDPELVKELCQKKGMVSVCGFPTIKSCKCTGGLCTGV